MKRKMIETGVAILIALVALVSGIMLYRQGHPSAPTQSSVPVKLLERTAFVQDGVLPPPKVEKPEETKPVPEAKTPEAPAETKKADVPEKPMVINQPPPQAEALKAEPPAATPPPKKTAEVPESKSEPEPEPEPEPEADSLLHKVANEYDGGPAESSEEETVWSGEYNGDPDKSYNPDETRFAEGYDGGPRRVDTRYQDFDDNDWWEEHRYSPRVQYRSREQFFVQQCCDRSPMYQRHPRYRNMPRWHLRDYGGLRLWVGIPPYISVGNGPGRHW